LVGGKTVKIHPQFNELKELKINLARYQTEKDYGEKIFKLGKLIDEKGMHDDEVIKLWKELE
jgi:hypothetical protein